MSGTRLVLVRHAHTAMNGGSPDPILCGWTDVPLTALGERQAATLADRLTVDALYASPLRRARDTAAHCANGTPIVYDPGLREINCGRADGLPLREVERVYADAWACNAAEDDDAFRWPGGESYAEFRERVVSTIRAIAARHAGATVAIVTHTGVITQLLGHIAGRPAARWSLYRAGNASITELDWTGDGGVLRSFDVRDHLPAELRT